MPNSDGFTYDEYYPELEKANAQKRAQVAAMEAGTEEIRRLKAENDGLRERIRVLKTELRNARYGPGEGRG